MSLTERLTGGIFGKNFMLLRLHVVSYAAFFIVLRWSWIPFFEEQAEKNKASQEF